MKLLLIFQGRVVDTEKRRGEGKIVMRKGRECYRKKKKKKERICDSFICTLISGRLRWWTDWGLSYL